VLIEAWLRQYDTFQSTEENGVSTYKKPTQRCTRPPDSIRWSIQEIRRIAQRIVQRQISPTHVIAWSLWRRAHQANAIQAHQKEKSQL